MPKAFPLRLVHAGKMVPCRSLRLAFGPPCDSPYCTFPVEERNRWGAPFSASEPTVIVASQTRTQIIHASKVDRHALCPSRYKAELSAGRGATCGQQLEDGLFLHQMLRDFCSTMKGGGLGSDIDELIESRSRRFHSFGERAADVRAQATAALWSARAVMDRLGATVLDVERELCSSRMPVAILPDAVVAGLHLMLKGRLDVIALVDETLLLIDWKTGHFLPTDDSLAALPSSLVYEFLARHAFLKEHTSLPVETIEIAQAQVPTGETVSAVLGDEQREASKVFIREMAINLDARTFPARRNARCDWCPINGECELYQGDVGEAF